MKDFSSGFSPTTAEQWKARIIRDLKGEVFENLIWKNENGFDVSPFYTAADIKSEVDPAFYHSSWEVCATSVETSSSGINRDLLYQLNKGATAILVEAGRHNYENLLRDIKLEHITSTFVCTEDNLESLSKFLSKNYQGKAPKFSLIPANTADKKAIENWNTSVESITVKPAHSTSINSLNWFNRGALPYYEIAITLAWLTEWMDVNERSNLPPAPPLIRTAVDSDLFVQISKLRALRRLWEVLKPEFRNKTELYIIAETSLTNKSLADQYNNLLRSTVEAFAAIAGGCNELVVHNFDALSGKPNKTAVRLALNQQHILKEESYLDKMADVGCGSYYIENLTDYLAIRALNSFKEIMRSGGYLACVGNGTIQKEIEKQASLRQEKINSGEQIIVGVNKFRNEKEQPDYSRVAEVVKEKSIQNPVLVWEQQQNLKKA